MIEKPPLVWHNQKTNSQSGASPPFKESICINLSALISPLAFPANSLVHTLAFLLFLTILLFLKCCKSPLVFASMFLLSSFQPPIAELLAGRGVTQPLKILLLKCVDYFIIPKKIQSP